MLKQPFHIAELIARYLTETLTEQEKCKLEEWINESPENKALFYNLCDSEQQRLHNQKSSQYSNRQGWEEVNRKIQRSKRKHYLLQVSRYAALIVLPLMVALLVIKWPSESIDHVVVEARSTIVPGEKRAKLTLDDGAVIDLKSVEETLVKEKDGTAIRIDSTSLSYEAKGRKVPADKISYNKIEIPRGGEYSLVLSDGTKVYLNAMSTLRFPVQFSGNKREVELMGEALFEVKKGSTPFIVKTNGTLVEVLGTTFNISSYEGEEYKATLVKGSVKIHTAQGESQLLEPSQQACIETGNRKIKVRHVDTSLYTSWVDGKIHFKDQSLEQIMKGLSRWYDMKIVYKDERLKQLRFGCNINRYKEITPFLELLERTGNVKITINEKTIIFDHSY